MGRMEVMATAKLAAGDTEGDLDRFVAEAQLEPGGGEPSTGRGREHPVEGESQSGMSVTVQCSSATSTGMPLRTAVQSGSVTTDGDGGSVDAEQLVVVLCAGRESGSIGGSRRSAGTSTSAVAGEGLLYWTDRHENIGESVHDVPGCWTPCP